MYTFRILFRKVCNVASVHGKPKGKLYTSSGSPFLRMNRALVVSKLSRYEYESLRNPELKEHQLESLLRKRGSDFEVIQKHHYLHKEFEKNVGNTLVKSGFETRVVNRFEYTKSNIDWADVIISAGGDGTFLFAASRLMGNEKPIIGFNSDPTRSEGYLCLPKQYSTNIMAAIEKLRNGEFKWMFRSRIRITLSGERVCAPPIELHEREVMDVKHRFFDCVLKQQNADINNSDITSGIRVLPVLALNEVFIGENLSARVSYFELSMDESVRTKVKSSGLCVSTGTGSTSWHLSMNRLTKEAVGELASMLGCKDDEQLVDNVTQKYNDSLVFSPEAKCMRYSIREMISSAVWPNPRGIEPRGHVTKMEIRSRCFDAGLVVDGGVSFEFNDGMLAVLEMQDSDSLRTVTLID